MVYSSIFAVRSSSANSFSAGNFLKILKTSRYQYSLKTSLLVTYLRSLYSKFSIVLVTASARCITFSMKYSQKRELSVSGSSAQIIFRQMLPFISIIASRKIS